jgi:lysophospholipase L1-like esterase
VATHFVSGIALAVILAAPLCARAQGGRGAPVVYVALGDSTALGQGAEQGGGYPHRIARKLEQSGVPVRFENVAVGGATVAELRHDQVPKVIAAHPSLVTIGIGINDLVKERKLSDFSRDLEIAADFLRRTKATVVISNIPDLSLSPSAKGASPSLARRIDAFNAAIALIADRHGFVLADVHGATRRALRDRGAELFSKDGFHPSAAGYELWAEAMWPSIEQAVVVPRVQARRPPPAQ